jgi:uncharacterized damage-inducible protein DinB
MQRIFADYLKNLEELHHDTLDSIKDLPQEALDWSPFPGGNSLGVIVTHIAGAEKFWLGDVVAGEPTGRDRKAEFNTFGATFEELTSLLDESLDFGRIVLSNLEPDSLASMRISPRSGKEISIGWSLGHTLKHTAIHLGHIQITRELWENYADK